MKEKGFTLIELLAVIVILAIIALIATPMILGVIDTAKKGSFENSVNGVIKSAETDLAQEQLGGTNISYPYYYYLNENELTYKGKKLQSGIVMVEKDNITVIDASDGTYCANGTTGRLTVEKKNCESELPLVFYEELTFDNNTWNNEFYQVEQQLESDGMIEDFSTMWFQLKNNRLELEVPIDAGEQDYEPVNFMQYAISFLTPNFEKEYTITMEYETDLEAFHLVDAYFHQFEYFLHDDLNNMAELRNSIKIQVLDEHSKGVITFTKTLKANTKYYFVFRGPVSLDNIAVSGISLKGDNPYTNENVSYDTYSDAGAIAFDSSGVDISSQLKGIKIKGTADQFAYRYFFQTKKGIRSIERRILQVPDPVDLLEFMPCSGSSKYVRLIKELPIEYQVEVFETGCGSTEWKIMEIDPSYPAAPSGASILYYFEGEFVSKQGISPMSCSVTTPKIRILKNGNTLYEDTFENIYNNYDVKINNKNICV